MRPALEEMIKMMDERGLSTTRFTRVERADNKAIPRTYFPAADIVNLFPAMLSAAINDLEADTDDVTVDLIANKMLKKLLPAMYEALPSKEGNYEKLATETIRILKSLLGAYPKEMNTVAYNYLMFSFIAYAIASKNGLREMPTVMGGDGVFRYFAMLAVWDKLKPETQKAVVEDLAEQNLWGADPDAL